MIRRNLQPIGDRPIKRWWHARCYDADVIANVKWNVAGLPFALVVLLASIDCSNSTTLLCPQSSSDISANGACSTEGLVCPYANGGFDTTRQDSPGDCFGDFIEYACTQKKWTVAAQASTTCQLDQGGVIVGSTSCLPGIGRCATPAGTVGCQTSCGGGAPTSYSATCASGQFVVTPTSCGVDAGFENDASVSDAGSVEDAASDAGDD